MTVPISLQKWLRRASERFLHASGGVLFIDPEHGVGRDDAEFGIGAA